MAGQHFIAGAGMEAYELEFLRKEVSRNHVKYIQIGDFSKVVIEAAFVEHMGDSAAP